MFSLPDIKKYAQDRIGGRQKFADYITQKLAEEGMTPETFVDYGCGTGVTAKHIAAILSGTNVIGTDINSHLAPWDEAKPKNLSFRTNTPFNLSGTGLRTDSLLLSGVIHHVQQENEGRLMEDVRNTMNESGILIIHEHRLAIGAIRQQIEKVILQVTENIINKTEGMVCEYNFFTRERLEALLDSTGFQIIHTEDTEGRFVTIPTLNGNMVFFCKKR